MEIILHLIASPNDLTYQCIYVMHPVSQVGMKRQDGSFRLPMVTWGCVIVRCVQYVWVCRLWGAGMSHMSLFVWDVKCIIYINWRMGCHSMLFIYLRRLPWILSTPFFFFGTARLQHETFNVNWADTAWTEKLFPIAAASGLYNEMRIRGLLIK